MFNVECSMIQRFDYFMNFEQKGFKDSVIISNF